MPYPSNEPDELTDAEKCAAANSAPQQPMSKRREVLPEAVRASAGSVGLLEGKPAVEVNPADFAGAFVGSQ